MVYSGAFGVRAVRFIRTWGAVAPVLFREWRALSAIEWLSPGFRMLPQTSTGATAPVGPLRLPTHADDPGSRGEVCTRHALCQPPLSTPASVPPSHRAVTALRSTASLLTMSGHTSPSPAPVFHPRPRRFLEPIPVPIAGTRCCQSWAPSQSLMSAPVALHCSLVSTVLLPATLTSPVHV
jgi:hypothetical protein